MTQVWDYMTDVALFEMKQLHLFWTFGPEDYTDESRRLQLSRGKFIDVLLDKLGKRLLYMGAHFENTPYIDCTTEEDYVKYEKSHKADKNAKSRIEGCFIICT